MTTISSDLMLGILSMDVYNRGGGGFTAPQLEVNQIGDVEIGTNSGASNLNLPSPPDDIGFEAQAYTVIDGSVNGLTQGSMVISYRGTVFGSLLTFAEDAWYGWGIGGGAPYAQQAADAISFFQQIAGTIPTLSGAEPNIVLTGHSLGGGPAGQVAMLYKEKAVLFDDSDLVLKTGLM